MGTAGKSISIPQNAQVSLSEIVDNDDYIIIIIINTPLKRHLHALSMHYDNSFMIMHCYLLHTCTE